MTATQLSGRVNIGNRNKEPHADHNSQSTNQPAGSSVRDSSSRRDRHDSLAGQSDNDVLVDTRSFRDRCSASIRAIWQVRSVQPIGRRDNIQLYTRPVAHATGRSKKRGAVSYRPTTVGLPGLAVNCHTRWQGHGTIGSEIQGSKTESRIVYRYLRGEHISRFVVCCTKPASRSHLQRSGPGSHALVHNTTGLDSIQGPDC